MAIGVSRTEFWHSTIVGLRAYDRAHKFRRKMKDEEQYFLSIYFYEAVQTVVSNALRKKGSKALEYRKQTIFDEIEERRRLENPTEEEKIKYTNDLFAMLGQMQERFEAKQK